MITINRNIWSVDPYVYKATASGLEVYDLASESLVSFTAVSGGINSVWANSQYVYVATTNSGIFRSTVSSGVPNFSVYKSFPNITSDSVNYIHGNGDYLCAATISGVDRYTISTSAHSYVNRTYVNKCFQTTGGDYYYYTNPFYDIQELDRSLFNWKYFRTVTMSSPAPADDYEYYFEIPDQPGHSDYIYEHATQNEIRIISPAGQILSFYIETWAEGSAPGLWVKLPKDLDTFYVFYGSADTTVSGFSDGDSVFRLYDDFEDGVIDTVKWTVDDTSYASNTATEVDGALQMECYGVAYYTSLISNTTFSGGLVEASIKQYKYDIYDDFVNLTVYFGDTNNYSYIGAPDYDPHKIVLDGGATIISGTEYITYDYKNFALFLTDDIQYSSMGTETLTHSGAAGIVDGPITFKFISSWYYPHLRMDWVRVRYPDYNPPIYSVSSANSINSFEFLPKLYSSYIGGGGYTYEAQLDGVVEAAYFNDIYVTEGTSIYDNANIIFLATNFGAYAIEERRGNEDNLRKRIYFLET